MGKVKGLRRQDIEAMRQEAIRNIDHQREVAGGRDIVNMVMDRAQMTDPMQFGRKPTRRVSTRTRLIDSLKQVPE